MNHMGTDTAEAQNETFRAPSRRDFLRFAGAGGAALFLPSFLTACNEGPVAISERALMDVTTDVGVLNYAYMIAHFQYEFYRYVTYAPYIGARTLEVVSQASGAFARFQAHSLAQRNMFRNTIPDGRISDAVDFTFPDVNFTSRASVFAFMQNMEDMGAQTYCTLLTKCRSVETLAILSKIASVEARHAAVVRDLADIDAGRSDTAQRVSFASDTLIPIATGLETPRPLNEYMELIQQYTQTRIALVGV